MRQRSVPAYLCRLSRGALVLMPLLASGCDASDPYVRPGLWRPVQANDVNLRAMVANPVDLTSGRGAWVSSGDLAAVAVARLRADAVKPLADSSISTVHVSASGAGQPTAGGGGTAADPVAAAATASGGGDGS